MFDKLNTISPKGIFVSKKMAQKKRNTAFENRIEELRHHIKEYTPEEAIEVAHWSSGDLFTNINDMLASKTLNIYKGLKSNGEELFKEDGRVNNTILSKIQSKGFFNDLKTLDDLTKTQTGTQLINKVTRLDKEINFNYTTKKDMYDIQKLSDSVSKFNNIKSNGGYVIDFDIESLGGVNSYGYQQIDLITEISAKAFNVQANGSYNIAEEMTSVLGLSESEYIKYKNYIESLKGKVPGELSNRDNVFLKRFSMFSDKGINLEYTDGFEVKIGDTSKALSEKDLVVSVENALEGLKRYRQVGEQQEARLKSLGIKTDLDQYKKEYVKNVQEFIYNGKGSKGNYAGAVVAGHNIQQFDGPMISSYTGHQITNPKNAVLDTYQYIKSVNEILGDGTHLKDIDPKKLEAATKQFGPGTQDFLRSAYGVGSGQAHNAAIDVDNHFRLLLSDFGTSMNSNMKTAMDKIKPLTGKGTNGVFYLGTTGQQQWGTRNNSFNFMYDPLDNSFKSFGGNRIGPDGKITKDSFNAYGPKANALYTHEAYKIDFKGDWKASFKEMGLSDQELDVLYQNVGSVDSLYVLKSKEFQDKARLEAKFGKNNPHAYGDGKTFYQFFTDQDKLSTAMGARIADIKDNKLIVNNQAIDALGFKVMDVAEDGTVTGVRALSSEEALDQIIDRSTFRQTTDSGARTVREASYTRLQAQRKFRTENGISVSQVIAERVSQGKALTDDITTPLIQELGWNDLKDGRKITPERLTKPTVLDKYIENMDPFFAAMEELFEEKGMKDVFNIKETKAGFKVVEKVKGQYDTYSKKDFIFKNTLNNLAEHLTNNPLAINNSKPALMTAAEANKLDFNTFELFPELRKKKVAGELGNVSKDISSINLNDQNALIKLFSKGKFENIDVVPSGSAAYNALLEAYDTIGSMHEFKGVWGDISRRDLAQSRNVNLSVIQSQMMERLRTFTNEKREINSAFGYKYARTVQDPTQAMELLSGMNKDDIKSLISNNNLFANVEDFMSAKNAINDNSAISNIVDNYFMTFKEDDLLKQIEGMSSQQQKAIKSQYKLARQESTKRVEELLRAIQGTDVDLVMAGKGKGAKLALMQGGDIRELNLHKYTLTDGIIEFNLGGNFYAANHAYNTSDMVKYGKSYSQDLGKVRITNAVENAIDHTKKLENVVRDAKQGGRSILDDLTYNINSYRGKMLREASPRREALNYSNMMQRAMFVDYNGLISVLPELKKQGVFENIAKSQGKAGMEFLDQFNEIVDKIANNKLRPESLSELFANEKNVFFQIFDAGLAEEVNKLINFGDEETEELFKGISSYTKNTSYVEGYKTLDDNPMPHSLAKFDKTTRPPVYQYGNTVNYNIKDIKQGIKELPEELQKTLRVGHAASSPIAERYLYNTASGETAGLTMKFLQIDSNSLRNKILNDKNFNNAISGYGEHGQKALLERAKSLSTYEQQTLMDSRVHDIAFHQTNKQLIAAKKELLATHQNTIEMIQSMGHDPRKLYPTIKNGKVTYSQGISVKFGQGLGLFGDDETEILAKFDGLYRARYYKEGRLVTEDELSQVVKGLSGNDAIDAINKTFEQRLEVVRKFQTYGQKVFNDTSEKSTVETLAMGVGTVDKDVARYMKLIGEDDIVGKVLTKDYEDFVLDKILNKFTFEDSANIIDKYFKEKHSFSDALRLTDGFEDVSQIGALDSLKHKSLSMPITHGLEKLRNEDGTFKGKEDIFDRMFGEGNWSLLGDNKAIDFSDISRINLEELAKYADLNEEDFVYDSEGKKIGHKMFSHVTQVRDDSAGTYAGLDPSDGKGLKFSKLMNANLKASAYDNDTLGLAKKRFDALGLSDEYMKAFGHALNSDGTIKEEFLGKSILSPVTDRMEELLVKTPGQKLLSEFVDDPRYDYLTKEFKNHLEDITVDRAELAYSYKQGTRAISYNSNGGYREFNKLTKELPEHLRFNVVDLTKARVGVADDWLSLDIGGQGDTITGALNNPYTNNLMIKYGEGNNDYLAIARMPEKHFEDSLIKKEHVSQLNALQNKMQEINAGKYESQAELSSKKEQVNEIVERIKNLQKKDLTSKTGLANEALEVRMNQSFFGKASGIVMNDNNLKTIEDVASLSDVEKAKRYADLRKVNSGMFDKAMFGDKSLLEHYSEGKVLDSVFLSENAFEKMGYFNEEFMEKVFTNMDKNFDGGNFSKYIEDATDRKEGMINLLEKYGDSFVAVRYPEIMEGSDKPVLGFLNRNLKDNQMLVTGHTGMSMKMDHDGDMGAVARLSTSTEDGLGESMLNYITAGGGSKELTDQATAIQASMMKRAVNENYYWDNQVRNKVLKEGKLAKLEGLDGKTMLDHIGSEKVIDGNIISSMVDTSEMSIGELEGLRSKYFDYFSLVNKDDGHAKAVEAIKRDGLSVDEYAGAYSFHLYKDELTAKSANQSIGEINVTNQKINNALASLIDRTADDSSYQRFISKDIFHISEEAAISAKSSTEGLDPNRAKVWNQNILEYLTKDIDESRATEIKGVLKDWSETYTMKDMDPMKYWHHSEVFQKRAAETLGRSSLDTKAFETLLENKENVQKINKMVLDDFIEGIGSLRRTGNAGMIMEQLAIGQSTSGVKKGISRFISTDDFSNNYDGLAKMINMMESAAIDTENIHLIEKTKPEKYFTNTAGEIISASERNSSQGGIGRAILEGASDVFQGVKKSNLALGALSLAAGVLVAGYVGGRPRPADVQAMEEAQDYQTPMEGHSLIDPSLAFSNMGTKQGYVVNINARTDKGREHAVSAIQQALSSGTSSNINVSMNINDNYGNITDRDLERALADVMR